MSRPWPPFEMTRPSFLLLLKYFFGQKFILYFQVVFRPRKKTFIGRPRPTLLHFSSSLLFTSVQISQVESFFTTLATIKIVLKVENNLV